MDEKFSETRFDENPPETTRPEDEFPPVTEERHGEEELPPVSEARQAEARANLRTRFANLTDEDLEDVSREKTKTGKFELFVQKLMERYKWRRGVCQQQLSQGFEDIRDC
jgi:hypothetical protein